MEKFAISESLDSNRTIFLIYSLIGFLLYYVIFNNQWTYDDVGIILSKDIADSIGDHQVHSRTLRHITFLIDRVLFGYNHRYWNIQNIVYHVINAWLFFFVLCHFVRSRGVSFFISLLFLVHPIQVEVVAQVSHRKDSLALLFSQLALLLFMKAGTVGVGRAKYYLACCVMVLVALLTKQNAIVIIGIIVFYYQIFVCKNKNIFRYVMSFIAVSSVFIIYLAATFGYDNVISNYKQLSHLKLLRMNYVGEYSVCIYLLTLLKSWSFIFIKYFFPIGLGVNYVFAVPHGPSDPLVLVAIALIFLYFGLLWFGYRRDKVLLFGLIWLGLAWLPTSNIWPTANLAADRYCYFPSVGLFTSLAAAVSCWRGSLRGLVAVSFAFLLLFSFLTVRQASFWRDNPTLWRRALAASPQSVQAMVLVGYYDHFLKGDVSGAQSIYVSAARLHPLDAMPSMYLAKLYDNAKEHAEACRHYRDVVRKHERFPASRTVDMQQKAVRRIASLNCQ